MLAFVFVSVLMFTPGLFSSGEFVWVHCSSGIMTNRESEKIFLDFIQRKEWSCGDK
jgi:hypothetical protein